MMYGKLLASSTDKRIPLGLAMAKPGSRAILACTKSGARQQRSNDQTRKKLDKKFDI